MISIECQNISLSFQSEPILKNLSFQIKKAELVFLLGKSGTGKSVLLKTITGFYPLNEGSIFIQGKNIRSYLPKQLHDLRKIVGLVLQQPALFDFMNVFNNIAFGIRQLSQEYKEHMVHQFLKLVHLPESVLYKMPSELSFGMQKRISIARTLVLQPQILLFDEPTTGLDPITTFQIDALIEEIVKKLSLTVLVVSHDIKGALNIANRILFLDQGGLIADHTTIAFQELQDPRIIDFMDQKNVD